MLLNVYVISIFKFTRIMYNSSLITVGLNLNHRPFKNSLDFSCVKCKAITLTYLRDVGMVYVYIKQRLEFNMNLAFTLQILRLLYVLIGGGFCLLLTGCAHKWSYINVISSQRLNKKGFHNLTVNMGFRLLIQVQAHQTKKNIHKVISFHIL